MRKDWYFVSENTICDIRVVGVLVKNGKIFVQREQNGNEYALPGGHIQIGETLEEGLIREYKEETGTEIICRRMLWSEECFFEWNGKQTHNLSFYYLIDGEIPDNGTFISHKDNGNIEVGWLPIEEIQNITIYPEFLKQEIYHLDSPIKHFITKD